MTYECEYLGCRPPRPATGYVGGPRRQHPLCDEHVKPGHHPPDLIVRLHPNEPITAPCEHARKVEQTSGRQEGSDG